MCEREREREREGGEERARGEEEAEDEGKCRTGSHQWERTESKRREK